MLNPRAAVARSQQTHAIADRSDPHKPPEPMRPDPTREPVPPEQPEPKIDPPSGHRSHRRGLRSAHRPEWPAARGVISARKAATIRKTRRSAARMSSEPPSGAAIETAGRRAAHVPSRRLKERHRKQHQRSRHKNGRRPRQPPASAVSASAAAPCMMRNRAAVVSEDRRRDATPPLPAPHRPHRAARTPAFHNAHDPIACCPLPVAS